ncbi:MAG: hypothetical protein ACE364_09355 [Chlorobiota bacterium]
MRKFLNYNYANSYKTNSMKSISELVDDKAFIEAMNIAPNRIEEVADALYESNLTITDLAKYNLEERVNDLVVNYDLTDEQEKMIDSYALLKFIEDGTPQNETKNEILQNLEVKE